MIGLVAADRGLGETALVDVLPEVVVVAFAAVTHLADPWFLFALLAVGYWFASGETAGSPRRAGATAIAAVTCAYATTALGKAWFAVPRPPGATGPADVPTWLPALLSGWYEAQVLSDGFGFPSGHATGGAAAYLALAFLSDRRWTPNARYVAAAGVAVAVAASRVVIEVHYLVDVFAGLVVGGGVVLGALWLAGDPRVRRSRAADPAAGPTADLNPAPAFLLAAVVSAGVVDGDEPPLSARVAVPALVVTGVLWVGAYALADSLPVTLTATTAAVVAVVALPGLPERIEWLSRTQD
ncbi:phosphoesterase [Halobacteriales archaeon SW_8_68_21]|nr:MAG: phosphoesterase [Halobacteriales archaeon SW_8_68_21]